MPVVLAPIALKPATPSVDLNVCQDMAVLVPFLNLAFLALGGSCVVTHGKEGEHHEFSRHDEGYCLDLRIWGLQFGDYQVTSKAWWKCLVRWCSNLAPALAGLVGPFVFLVLEKNHLHLEWAGPGQVPDIKAFIPGKFFYMTEEVKALVL